MATLSNIVTPSNLATVSSAQTLTNKTISADSNTLSGIAASSFVLSNASGVIDGAAAQKVIPSGAVVGASDTQTLTNKTISGASNTLTVDGTDSVGFRNVPQNSQSASYTLVLSDSGKSIYHPSADTTARTWTIPSNASVAFPVGTAIAFINDTSAGVVTIAITSDTLVLAGAGTTGSRTLAASGMATAIKMTSTRWMISGSGLT
jgi:WD40 repeat protein